MFHQTIEFDRVSFSYENGKKVLDHVSLAIQANQLTVVMGESGSGKSTLLDVLMGFQVPGQGSIRLDRQVLKEEQMELWRRSIGYVGSNVHFFRESIRENLLAVKPSATDDELWDALHKAGCESFVRPLPEGLETLVSEEGRTFSTGERQRLVIARALLKKPALLILDEVTSALDLVNEAAIMQTLRELLGETTILMVAHRSTIMHYADRIVEMKDGRIVGE